MSKTVTCFRRNMSCGTILTEEKDVNLAAYQMGAEVLDRLNIHEGTIVNYHQNRRKTQNYQVDLEAMQYDILYGEQYVYQGQDPFMRTKLKLGAVPVVFSAITKLSDGTYYITERIYGVQQTGNQ